MSKRTPRAPSARDIRTDYDRARTRYGALGVDTDAALDALAGVPVSLHCWQGDDVRGFEVHEESAAGGGIMATGNCPGAARNGDELRADAVKAMSLIPGKLRFNVHAIYAETDGRRVGRDELAPEHFARWIAWAGKQGIQLDFNDSFFGHPLANSGYTLSSDDPKIRRFWIRHAIACRRIAEAIGRAQGGPCVLNHWIPDGAKDQPIDRWGPRARLTAAYDEILAADVDRRWCHDFLEGKLFGIGSEDYVVGSHEFYLAYVLARRNAGLCLDMGHFHPTETLHDKVSAILPFSDDLLLHVSRGIRWDSDHVVICNDDLRALFLELVRGNALGRVRIALDFFDASINRVGAWVIGTRATQKALLAALLEPRQRLRSAARRGDGAATLALLEEARTLPLGAVWDLYCQRAGVPVGPAWIDAMHTYETHVQRKRT
jgi:L-rhamnose isomerase